MAARRARIPGVEMADRILDAATALMAEQGFHGASMRAIAGAAGCNVTVLYRHFESKEAILEAVVGRRRAIWLGNTPPIERRTSAVATLTALFRFMFDRDAEFDLLFRITQSESARVGGASVLPDDLWPAMETVYKGWLLDLFPHLADGAGTRALTRTFLTLTHGGYVELMNLDPQDRARAMRRKARDFAVVLARAIESA